MSMIRPLNDSRSNEMMTTGMDSKDRKHTSGFKASMAIQNYCDADPSLPGFVEDTCLLQSLGMGS